MNNEIATYTIGVIGFERAERLALRRAVDMTESRQPSFKPFDKARGGCPHLIMVNADEPSAMRAWNRFRRDNAHHASFSPIFVGCNPTDLPCPEPYVLQRPIETTRLFEVLDQAVVEVHGFRPVAAAASSQPPEINALVVADSLPVRVQMRGVLSSIASRVDFTATGAQALELTDTYRYSVIFLDGTLPGEDAYELCGRIKSQPLQQEVVMVMLTSSASPADRVMGLLAGFDNYLAKPIQRAMFNELAAELVRPAAAI